jgi:hypothetical protein
MDGSKLGMEPPETPDYYEDLELQQTATVQEIKRAHNTLAKIHHPDKQGLGVCVDAHDFRKVSMSSLQGLWIGTRTTTKINS